MSYHSASEHSAGFIASLKNGRELAANITQAHNMTQRGYRVFAYSVFYVYYEQVRVGARACVRKRAHPRVHACVLACLRYTGRETARI